MDQIIEQTYQDIKSIKIQGATNVARASLFALKDYSKKSKVKNNKKFIADFMSAGKALSEARVTEPLARNAVKFVNFQLEKNSEMSVKELKEVVKGSISAFLEEIEENVEEISKAGQKIIKGRYHNIFTHCHSSSITHMLIDAAKAGKKFTVYNTETRPLFQGRITSKELLQNKVKDIMIVDSAAPFVVSRFSGKDLMMDLALLGSDALALNGGAVNKVGSFGIALSAKVEKVPLYVVANLLKTDVEAQTVKEIEIELRNAKEVWKDSPKGLKIINFAFDLVPPKFIKGIITQIGIIKPHNLEKAIRRHYSWMLK